MNSICCWDRGELHAELFGAAGEVVEKTLAVAFLVVLLPRVHIRFTFGEHGVDQTGQFVGDGPGVTMRRK